LVLVILAVMWVLVLVPPLLRSRSDGRPNHSISSFQRQLRTLQRTGGVPARGSVSYLRGPAPMGRQAPSRSLYADDGYGYGRYADDDGYGYSARPRPMRSARYAAVQREAMRRRRQNVLLTLLAATFGTGVLAFGMELTSLTWVFVACSAALVLYLLLLVQLRKAEELRAGRGSWSRMAA
jgi:hypothetical protein